jgi:hypothetical protein
VSARGGARRACGGGAHLDLAQLAVQLARIVAQVNALLQGRLHELVGLEPLEVFLEVRQVGELAVMPGRQIKVAQVEPGRHVHVAERAVVEHEGLHLGLVRRAGHVVRVHIWARRWGAGRSVAADEGHERVLRQQHV